MAINIDFKAPLDFLTSIVKSIRIWWLKKSGELYQRGDSYWLKKGKEEIRCCPRCLEKDKDTIIMQSPYGSPETFKCPKCDYRAGKPSGKVLHTKKGDWKVTE